jgi:predicted negative regulator of RcsB-dependent stress response
MKKITKRILIVAVFLATATYFGYNYIMHGGERDLATEAVDYAVSSQDISAEFTTNIDASNKKYLEKAVEITGTITSINAKEVIINTSIICNLKQSMQQYTIGQKVVVKGRIVGYDDLLGDLKLDQCTIIKNIM